MNTRIGKDLAVPKAKVELCKAVNKKSFFFLNLHVGSPKMSNFTY